MKVMSFNILNNGRQYEKTADIVTLIRRHNPDVIGMQEVNPYTRAMLCIQLDDYYCFGEPRGSRNKEFDEACLVFVKRGIEIIREDTLWLSDTPEQSGSRFRFALYPRNVTMVTVMYDNRIITIYNTHFEHLIEFVRKKQAAVLLKIANNSENCIFTGDFNADRSFESIRLISNKYSDLCADFTENTIHLNGKKFVRNQPIDHIFISDTLKCNDIKIVKEQVNGRYVSDHYPLVADIEFK